MKNRNWFRNLSLENRITFLIEKWNETHLWCDEMNIAKENAILNQEHLFGLGYAKSQAGVVRGF